MASSYIRGGDQWKLLLKCPDSKDGKSLNYEVLGYDLMKEVKAQLEVIVQEQTKLKNSIQDYESLLLDFKGVGEGL